MTDIPRIFAVGMGIKEAGSIRWVKTFRHTSKNDAKVQDFLHILQERLEYDRGNAHIDMMDVDLDALHHVFVETDHPGAASFTQEAMKLPEDERKQAFIYIMMGENASNPTEARLLEALSKT